MKKSFLFLLAALAWVQPAFAQFAGPGQRPQRPQAWVECIYQSTLATLVNGQGSLLQCDNKGSVFNVIRDAAGNARGANVDASNRLSVTVDNIAGALTLGTITTVGTVTNLAQMNGVALLMGNGVTGPGSQRVTISSDNTAFSVNSTLSAETVKVIGTVNVAAAQTIAVTNAGTFATQVAALALAQGSTTSGQTGPLIQGAVTTSAPTYTTAQTSPLSLDTGGALRVNVVTGGGTGGTSSTFGSAFPGTGTAIGANASGATGGLMAGVVQCDSTAIYDASTNGSTELKALTSGRSVYVCGYVIAAAGTVNVKLIYGTGTACATGSNNMTPAYQLIAQGGIADSGTFYRGLKTASANALCINTSAGVAVQAIVYYSVI